MWESIKYAIRNIKPALHVGAVATIIVARKKYPVESAAILAAIDKVKEDK